MKVNNTEIIRMNVNNIEIIRMNVNNAEIIRMKVNNTEIIKMKVNNTEIIRMKVNNTVSGNNCVFLLEFNCQLHIVALFLKPCKSTFGDFVHIVGIVISSSVHWCYIHGSRVYKNYIIRNSRTLYVV